MHRGYVKLWRRFKEWEWYHDMVTRVVFIELLLSVTHKPMKYAGLDLETGSIVTGIHKLSEESGLSVKQVRRGLSNLEKTGEIARKRASRYSIITLCNYDKYHKEEEVPGQAEGKQRASRGQLNKNEKNEKNEKNKDKILYGPFDNVVLSQEEITKLEERFGLEVGERIDALSEYLESSGKKYKSHYATLLTWARRDKKNGARSGSSPRSRRDEENDAREQFAKDLLVERAGHTTTGAAGNEKLGHKVQGQGASARQLNGHGSGVP